MKILILAAMAKEVNLLKNMLENRYEKNIDRFNLITGVLNDKEIIIAQCGIGKINSAVNTFRLITLLNPDIIINSGVAGGAASLPIGDVIIADKVAHHDVWCGPGTEYGRADGYPKYFEPLAFDSLNNEHVHSGLICSGDKFISTPQEIKFIKENFPDVKAVDMESASIAQVCTLLNKKFIIIRVVSDQPGEGENIEQYKNFWEEAPVKTFEVVNKIIENI